MDEESLEEIILGLASQIAEREDSFFCGDVRDKLFGPMEFSRRDLAALNIMRGRDSGLPDYNTVRKCYGLDRIKRWQDINPKLAESDPELADKIFGSLQKIYGNMDDVDLYVGGMLESVDRPGPLFSKVIKEQFQRLRDADRFWFENKEHG